MAGGRRQRRSGGRAWARSGLAALLLGPAAVDSLSAAGADWSARFAFEERYDDNTTQLSPRDLDDLARLGGGTGFGCGSGSTVTTDHKFSITRPDDYVAIPQVSAGVRAGWLDGRPTTIGLEMAAYQYAEDSIKDYQWYRLSISQPLRGSKEHGTTLSASFELVPTFYLRNLRSDRTGEELSLSPPPRREVTYRKRATQVRIDQEVVSRRLRFLGTVGVEERNYNRCFDERDSRMPYEQGDLVWDPLGDQRLRFRVSFRREDLHALGAGLGTIFTEDDVSSRRDILAGDARVRWGRKGRQKTIRLHYESETRDYTSADPNDRFHFERNDRRRYATLAFQIDLRKGWFLTAEGERDSNRSHFPPAALGATPAEDTTDYDEKLYQFGLGYDFGYGAGTGGGRPPTTPRD